MSIAAEDFQFIHNDSSTQMVEVIIAWMQFQSLRMALL